MRQQERQCITYKQKEVAAKRQNIHQIGVESRILIDDINDEIKKLTQCYQQQKTDTIFGLLCSKNAEKYSQQDDVLLRSLRSYFSEKFQAGADVEEVDVREKDEHDRNVAEMHRLRRMYKKIEMEHIMAQAQLVGAKKTLETIETQMSDICNNNMKYNEQNATEHMARLTVQIETSQAEIDKLKNVTLPQLLNESSYLQTIPVIMRDYEMKEKKVTRDIENREKFVKLLLRQLNCHELCLMSLENSMKSHEETYTMIKTVVDEMESLSRDLKLRSEISENCRNNGSFYNAKLSAEKLLSVAHRCTE